MRSWRLQFPNWITMKPHLKLLAKLPQIDPILAVEGLFVWQGEHNADEAEQPYSTVESEDLESSDRTLISRGSGHDIRLTARSGQSDITIKATNHLIHDQALSALLSAMGLNASVQGNAIEFPTLDAEALSDRLSTLETAWRLLRRLKLFEPDGTTVAESACKVVQFVLEWHRNRVKALEALEDREQSKVDRETTELETRATRFKDWKISGLEALTLHYEPRGSVVELNFVGHHPMMLPAMNFDWPVGKSVAQAMAAVNRKTKFGKYEVRPTRIPEDVQSVLNGLIITNNLVKIADKLPKKLYDKVNETLVTIGGRWNTAQQAHVFDEDPTSMIDMLIDTGETFTAKDYEFFPTQPPVVSRLIEKAQIEPGMKVLEPSAGRAAIAMAAAEIVGKANVTCFELMPDNVKALRTLGFEVGEPRDFLEITAEPLWDRVVANPPFSGGRDVAHIMHAMEFLKPGGILVSVASTQWQTHDTRPAKAFQEYLKSMGAQVEKIEAGAFKESGTNVATTLLVIKKPEAVVKSPAVVQPAIKTLEEQLSFLL